MTRLTFVLRDGALRVVEANNAGTVMDAALAANVPGISGECGGGCACSTCHVYVDDAWLDKCGAPDELEMAMLGFAFNVTRSSRLCCQIPVTADLDGLIVRVVEREV